MIQLHPILIKRLIYSNNLNTCTRQFGFLKSNLNKLNEIDKLNKLNKIKFNYRFFSGEKKKRSKDFALYGLTTVLICLSLTYASVPLYRLYCQATGKGGKARIADDFLANKVKRMKKNKEKLLSVIFLADKESKMRWNFKPTQSEIKVYPGETALAFFTAKNPTDKPVNGVSTYSVAPIEAGQYLNKIQCFCFEEQRLDAGEEVDMPVFFYFDPEIAEDPRLEKVNEICLSYTFFEAQDPNKKLISFPSLLPQRNIKY